MHLFNFARYRGHWPPPSQSGILKYWGKFGVPPFPCYIRYWTKSPCLSLCRFLNFWYHYNIPTMKIKCFLRIFFILWKIYIKLLVFICFLIVFCANFTNTDWNIVYWMKKSCIVLANFLFYILNLKCILYSVYTIYYYFSVNE